MSPKAPLAGVKYQSHGELYKALRESVDQYFESKALPRVGGIRLGLKALFISVWFLASYLLLVFVASTFWQAAVLGISLALTVAAIGFNIQHDGGHKAVSRSARLNRLFAFGLDLVGASSYVWNYKHNLLHHHHTNVDGVDEDIEAAPFLRLAPSQDRHFLHRFQHLYAWPLYGMLTIKWHLFDDFRNIAAGNIGGHPFPRPKGRELLLFVVGKLLFFGWAFAVPSLVHPFWMVAVGYLTCSALVGVILSVVFQLAHCVEETTFWVPPEEGRRMEHSWAAHQLSTTADFAPRNRFLTWFLGGLNFQVEHHLFPHISHVHYAQLAPVVAAACREHGVSHVSVPTFRGAIRSHYRFLRRLGRT